MTDDRLRSMVNKHFTEARKGAEHNAGSNVKGIRKKRLMVFQYPQ
jgi:hypothetical protein